MSPVQRAALRLSVAVYRVLMLRYPSTLRRRYGSEIRALFEDAARRRIAEDGLIGLASAWWRALRDLGRPLPGPVGSDVAGRDGARAAALRDEWGAGDGGRAVSARRWMTGWWEDLTFGVRSLVREPRFTLLVVGVLAVGIALNLSAFAALNAYLLRPLPFPDADRLVSVRGGESVSWTEVGEVFERAVSWDLDVFTITGEGRPQIAPGAWVTPDFLDVYGVRAQVGRIFRPEEGGRDGAPVAMISNRLWRERFGGDPGVVGRTFSAFTSDRPDHAELFTIVGVLPTDFWYLNEYTEVLAPIRDEGAVYAGRLRPNVPRERAEDVLTEIASRSMDRVPPGFRVEVVPLQELHAASVRPTLLVLQAAVLLVLLVACADAAVLFLVRSARRERELGVRRTLGASRARLARQLILEGGIIAAMATVLGLVLSAWGLELGRVSVETRLGVSVPGGTDALSIDGTVLAAAAFLAAVVGLAFGSVPLVSSLRGALSVTMREGTRGGTESKGRRRLRSVMVAAEVALSLALLTGAGLMVRSAIHLQRQDLGFDPSGVVRGLVGLREASYPEATDRVAAFSRLRNRIADVPGVERVGLSSMTLFGTRFNPRMIEGRRDDRITRARAVAWTVDQEYFGTLDIPIARGRGFTEGDAAGSESVAVVSASLARDLWGETDPGGFQVRVAPLGAPGMDAPDPGPWLRVVGVAADVERELGGGPAGDLYRPLAQGEPLWMNALVRFVRPSPQAIEEIESVIAEVDPDIPFASVQRLDAIVHDALEPTEYVATLLVGFSFFALVLAVLGLYGVVSYAARQHQRDVAIRMALGADRSSVTSLFVRQGLYVVGAGLAAGTLGGFLLGRALASQLHGVRPGDPATHALLAGLLAVTALAAVWIPARRAAESSPMGVLREE